MPSMSDIRFHIRSVKQTRQITNAMRLVSAARMRRALEGIRKNQAYFIRALDVITDIRAHTGEVEHPYITRRPGDRAAYIVIAGDRGLSGAYNHDALALADQSMRNRNVEKLFTIGSVATLHFLRRGITPDVRFEHLAERPRLEEARRLADILIEMYDENEIDEVHVLYTRFVNTLVFHARDQKLLPVELGDFKRPEGLPPREADAEILYEPSPEAVLTALIPQLLIGYLYGALVHSYASENCSRMSAMEGATRSADEMIEKLTLQYHAVRQLSITEELADILGAARATQTAPSEAEGYHK